MRNAILPQKIAKVKRPLNFHAVKFSCNKVSVYPKDRDALRFLWRENSIEAASYYKMNAHLFGKISSPCVTNFILKKAGAEKKDIIHPSVITFIDQDFT